MAFRFCGWTWSRLCNGHRASCILRTATESNKYTVGQPARQYASVVPDMANNKVEISVNEGKLIGIEEKGVYGNYYTAFRGIPYAKPPIGELRFKDPVPAEPWSGSRDASKHGNMAVQFNDFTHKVDGDEDCLYLNVYTTKIDHSEKRTVMVWIHGGAFFFGSGDELFYGADYIVQKDVVFVTLNYRLGVLGFLNLYNKVATGNQGLKDIIMALQWVQKNISKFGGDPENVTIFGASAGGALVHYLTLSPLAKGLFHKAISQSGVMRGPWAFTDQQLQLERGYRLADKLGKATADPEVAYEFFKTIDAKKLIETERNSLLTDSERLRYSLLFTPSLDHESSNPVIPEDPETFMCREVKVPFLLGFNSCEGSFVVCNDVFERMSKERLETINCDFKKAILPRCLATLSKMSVTIDELKSLYFGDKAVSEETLMNYVDFIGDEFFYRYIMEVVDIQTKLNNKTTYLYQFSYENENNPYRKIFGIKTPGVTHTEEWAYLFHPRIIEQFGLSAPAVGSENYKMINCLTQMWTDFAKTGNPTPTTNLWLPVTDSQSGKYNYLNIDTNSQMKVFHKGEERWDWEKVKNKLRLTLNLKLSLRQN